jgi:hypothetical protein
MNKKELQAELITRHINNLNTLYELTTGEKCSNPTLLNRRLQQIERKARAITTELNNGKGDATQLRVYSDKVKQLFNGKLPKGFFINTDSRGCALKISDKEQINLHRDFGGYYILAPLY